MKPARDPKYLAWIRSLPCSVPGCHATYIEAAHTGPHGMSQKSSDHSAIPLCGRHHRRGADSYHALGPARFQQRHSIDIQELVKRLNAKPVIRIDGARFVADIGGEEYMLRPVQDGVAAAIAGALAISRERRREETREAPARRFDFSVPIASLVTDLGSLVRRLNERSN
jgi:hypothetical protein